MNQEHDSARDLMACLGDSSRFRIVRTLAAGERYVSQLAREVGLSQSCTTRHLQALQRAGLVKRTRQGRRVMFMLGTEEPRAGGLLRWMVRGAADVRPRVARSAPRPEGAGPESGGGPSRTPKSRAGGESLRSTQVDGDSDSERSPRHDGPEGRLERPTRRHPSDIEDYLL